MLTAQPTRACEGYPEGVTPAELRAFAASVTMCDITPRRVPCPPDHRRRKSTAYFEGEDWDRLLPRPPLITETMPCATDRQVRAVADRLLTFYPSASRELIAEELTAVLLRYNDDQPAPRAVDDALLPWLRGA